MSDPVTLAVTVVVGGAVVKAVFEFLTTVFWPEAAHKKRTALDIQRNIDRELNARRTDITEEERESYERGIDGELERRLSDIEKSSARVNKTLQWVAAIGGLLGILATLLNLNKLKEVLVGSYSSIELFVQSAMAADGGKSELTPFLPYVAVGVLIIMALSFLIALGAVLLIKDTKENQARIKAADNIIKTFGGFFTGLATTLLH